MGPFAGKLALSGVRADAVRALAVWLAAPARRQVLEDRAVGAVVALAMFHQFLKRIAQARQFFDLLVQLGNVLPGQCLDVGAGPLAVLPEGQQFADFFQRKPPGLLSA
ncbi:hypothetical protein PCPL58_4586 [Pseudomonas cerasi]|nr:hypothetical protein PCPL58_4586 [Pseudomonas cerasi]